MLPVLLLNAVTAFFFLVVQFAVCAVTDEAANWKIKAIDPTGVWLF
jgi:hypothetical protein